MHIAPPVESQIIGKVAAAEQALNSRIGRGRAAARVTVATAVVAIGVTAANIIGLREQTIDPAAAAALHSAALATVKHTDPVVAPGQYLRIETTSVWGNTAVRPDGASVGWLTRSTSTLWVPEDRAQDWVLQRTPRRPTESFGPVAEEMARLVFEQSLGSPGNSYELVRAPGGMFHDADLPLTRASAVLPTDPQDALEEIYRRTSGAGRSPDGEALVYIADLLRDGTMPASERATLYEAAALIPGIEIIDRQANLDGQIGIAIGRVESHDNTRQDIIIDPETGALIGEREVALAGNRSGFPAGTATTWTAITTTVVDAAPEASDTSH